MTLPVKSVTECVVMAPARAFAARTWSPRIGVAVPALTASGACSLQEAKAAVVTSASAARVAATETRSMRRAILTLYGLRMSYSFNPRSVSGQLTGPQPTYIFTCYIIYIVVCIGSSERDGGRCSCPLGEG